MAVTGTKEDLLSWRRRRSTHTREVRAETVSPEMMALMQRMADEIGALKARLHRFETALVETAQEHALREPQL